MRVCKWCGAIVKESGVNCPICRHDDPTLIQVPNNSIKVREKRPFFLQLRASGFGFWLLSFLGLGFVGAYLYGKFAKFPRFIVEGISNFLLVIFYFVAVNMCEDGYWLTTLLCLVFACEYLFMFFDMLFSLGKYKMRRNLIIPVKRGWVRISELPPNIVLNESDFNINEKDKKKWTYVQCAANEIYKEKGNSVLYAVHSMYINHNS